MDAPDRAERKLATVLFADLVGSTAAADEQDPERTRARLERFYDAMTEEIEAAGGTIEKFAGDAVMAAFGAPEALEDHAERALHAGLAMQHRVEQGLALRIGVNTGEVVAGRARESSSFVSGDVVNVAARLEQAAEPGEILAGERTVAAVRGAFEFGERREAVAKGKADAVGCRPVLRALTLMRPRGVRGLAPAFVGRDDELERLLAAYARTVAGARPELVTILGEAGVGKTRLVRELWGRVSEEETPPLRRTGRCLAYGEGITYWPLAEVLKEQLGILESDPPEDVLRRLGDRAILGLTLGLDVGGELHPLAARDRLHTAWIALLSQLTADRPLVLLIEDVHWAEQALLDLIERLARDVAGPLLVVTTARPDFPAAWDARLDAETIWLEPLASETASSLVDALVAGDLPVRVRRLVVERAEGNPFFVEEVLGSLIDAGVIERVIGGWRAHELPAGFEIPDSVQAVIAARIDLLGEAEKAALQAAAVIGRTFWTGPIYELVEGFHPDLRALESRDFIVQRSASSLEGEVEYVFKHALTREVAYGGLTKARRAVLHAAFAEWIERFGGGRDEHAPLLAHHYAEAVRPEDVNIAWADAPDRLEELRTRAIAWFERAADLAIGRYEIDEGVALLHRALALERDETRQSNLWRKIGLASALKFDGEAFRTAMERSLAVCHDGAIRANTYADLALQTAIRSGIWPTRPEHQLVQGWIEQALELAPPDSAARIKALIADCFWDRKTGRQAAEEASALAERLGDIPLRAHAFAALSWVAFAEREHAESLAWAVRTLCLIDELSDPDQIADVYEAAIPAACGMGRFHEARDYANAHADVVKPLTPHHRLHGVSVALEVEELGGKWDRIISRAAQTKVAVDENLATPCIRNARSLLVTALAAEYSGDTATAAALEGRAQEIALKGYDFVLAAPRARLALARGDVEAALAALPEVDNFRISFALANAAARLDALGTARDDEAVEREASLFVRPGTYLEPFALRALGIVREDAELIRKALDRFEAMNLEWYVAQTRALL